MVLVDLGAWLCHACARTPSGPTGMQKKKDQMPKREKQNDRYVAVEWETNGDKGSTKQSHTSLFPPGVPCLVELPMHCAHVHI